MSGSGIGGRSLSSGSKITGTGELEKEVRHRFGEYADSGKIREDEDEEDEDDEDEEGRGDLLYASNDLEREKEDGYLGVTETG